MNCPHCGTPNADQNRFCLKCGKPVTVQGAPQQQPASATRMRNITQPGAYPQPQQPAAQNFPPPQQQPVYQQLPQQQMPQQPVYQEQYYQPPMQQQQGDYISPSSGQVGLSMLNIWGPFAGYGTRRRHVGWLMDGKASHLKNLTQRIHQRLQERQVAGMRTAWQTLTAKGLLVESRPYFLVNKGLATLGLNISAFGKDLFVSIATYLKPPISNFRALLAGMSVLLFFVGGPIMGAAMGAATSGISLYGGNLGSAMSSLALTLCCMGPLLGINAIAFPILLLVSAYKWLTERDFFALLRIPPNEFSEDDLMAMEKATEQTVRISLDDIGLNPAELKPASVQGQETRLI